jgi:hypothetical protein
MEGIAVFPYFFVRHGGLPWASIPKLASDQLDEMVHLHEAQTALAAVKLNLQAVFDAQLKTLPQPTAFRTELFNQRKRFFNNKAVQWQRLKSHADNISPEFYQILDNEKHRLEQAQTTYQACLKNWELAWQKQIQESENKISQIAQQPKLSIGLVSTGSDLVHQFEQESRPDSKAFRAMYRYITRAAAKTSPLSQLGTVRFLHPNFGEALPWESEVQRFWPSVQLRPLFYGLLLADQKFVQLLPYRWNTSLTRKDVHLSWLAIEAEIEHVRSIDVDTQLLEVMTEMEQAGALKQSAWVEFLSQKERMNLEEAVVFLDKMIEIGILLPVLPENGKEGGWAKNLMQHLAFMGVDAPTTLISMLNTLTKSASNMAYMHANALKEAQVEVARTLEHSLAQMDVLFTGVKAAELYSHDVIVDKAVDIEITDLEQIAINIGREIQALKQLPIDANHVEMLHFAQSIGLHEAMPFVHFGEQFLKWQKQGGKSGSPGMGGAFGKAQYISALVQCYKDQDGKTIAVLNGLGPGGGRLLGRFLTMFPSQMTEDLLLWNQSPADDILLVGIREIGASNANFHPKLTDTWVDWPNALSYQAKSAGLDLSDIGVSLDASGLHLTLVQLSTGKQIRLLEFGLEARREKSKMLQLLLSLGVADWSKTLWKQVAQEAATDQQVIYMPRKTNADASIIFHRAKWQVTINQSLITTHGAEFYLLIQALVTDHLMPNQLFYTFDKGEKPQLLVTNEPLSVEVLRHALQKRKTRHLVFEEMLPSPNEWKHLPEAEVYVREFCLEIKL